MDVNLSRDGQVVSPIHMTNYFSRTCVQIWWTFIVMYHGIKKWKWNRISWFKWWHLWACDLSNLTFRSQSNLKFPEISTTSSEHIFHTGVFVYFGANLTIWSHRAIFITFPSEVNKINMWMNLMNKNMAGKVWHLRTMEIRAAL